MSEYSPRAQELAKQLRAKALRNIDRLQQDGGQVQYRIFEPTRLRVKRDATRNSKRTSPRETAD